MKYCCKEHLTGLSRKRFEDSKAGDVTLLMHIYEILMLSKLKSKEFASSEESSCFSNFEPVVTPLLHTILI
jgi:hypothetical protein